MSCCRAPISEKIIFMSFTIIIMSFKHLYNIFVTDIWNIIMSFKNILVSFYPQHHISPLDVVGYQQNPITMIISNAIN